MKNIIVLMIVVLSLALTGCSEGSEIEEKTSDMSEFVIVEHTDAWFVVYHKKTKVMYVVSDDAYNYGTFTLLVNADGTPMIWEED